MREDVTREDVTREGVMREGVMREDVMREGVTCEAERDARGRAGQGPPASSRAWGAAPIRHPQPNARTEPSAR